MQVAYNRHSRDKQSNDIDKKAEIEPSYVSVLNVM